MYSSSIIMNSEREKKLTDIIKVKNMKTINSLKNEEIINKQKKKISLDSIKKIMNNHNDYSLKKYNINGFHLLKFKPKRLLKL